MVRDVVKPLASLCLIALAACSLPETEGTGSIDAGDDAAMDAGRHNRRDAGRDASAPIDASHDAEEPWDAAPTCHEAPYPIVMHHGFFGFHNIGPLEYFYRVADALRAEGHVVYEPTVDPFNDSETRAVELADDIADILMETGACKVNIIAHSQGGVDARILISQLGYAERVASLVTVATPHRGTEVANLVDGAIDGWGEGVANFIGGLASQVLQPGADEGDLVAALVAMKPSTMDTFNAAHPDDPRVPIFSVAGRTLNATGNAVCMDSVWPNPGGTDFADALLLFSALYVNGDGNPNDGLVSVESARWGTFLGCFPADHFDEIGQIADLGPNLLNGYDHVAMYKKIVTYLRDRGF